MAGHFGCTIKLTSCHNPPQIRNINLIQKFAGFRNSNLTAVRHSMTALATWKGLRVPLPPEWPILIKSLDKNSLTLSKDCSSSALNSFSTWPHGLKVGSSVGGGGGNVGPCSTEDTSCADGAAVGFFKTSSLKEDLFHVISWKVLFSWHPKPKNFCFARRLTKTFLYLCLSHPPQKVFREFLELIIKCYIISKISQF